MKYIGAHVSAAGGVWNAPENAFQINATAYALFTKNQRQWKVKDLTESDILKFKEYNNRNGYQSQQIIPHDSYLINLAHPDQEGWQKSVDAFLDECHRCEKLGLSMLNFHPGATLGKISEKEGIQRIAQALNFVLDHTEYLSLIIENTAGQGSALGYSFGHLRDIIAAVKNPERVGVCIDTCHAFAAGYDLRSDQSFQNVLDEFDSVVGLPYLRAFHVNDSKKELGSRVDRHASLGMGKIGWGAFSFLLKHSASDNIPLILETPQPELWPAEIKKLKEFSNEG